MKKNVVIISYSLGNHPSALAQRMNVFYDLLAHNNINVQAIYSNGSAKASNDIFIKGLKETHNYNIFIRLVNEIYVSLKAMYYIFLLRMLNFVPMVIFPPLLQELRGYPQSVIGLILGIFIRMHYVMRI